jgi:hypothetical protein
MPNRSGKKQDINEKAFSIVQKLTGQTQKEKPEREKNEAAVMLGRLGGLKGGRARAEKLSPVERKLAAQKAAKARWHGKRAHQPDTSSSSE